MKTKFNESFKTLKSKYVVASLESTFYFSKYLFIVYVLQKNLLNSDII